MVYKTNGIQEKKNERIKKKPNRTSTLTSKNYIERFQKILFYFYFKKRFFGNKRRTRENPTVTRM